MVRKVGNICSEDEELKSIHVCELIYRVVLDTTGPLLETKSRNKYIMVTINHYSKWCKAKAIINHGAKTVANFLEDDVICRYGVAKFVLTNNGGEWVVEFGVMCKDYGIHHQHTTPQWPKCDGMAECLIKTLKHGIIVLSITPENVDCCRNPTLAKCGGEAQHLEKVRSWSPPGLPNVQSSTARPKTPRIGVFLVLLERS
jgi:hypothetical protein